MYHNNIIIIIIISLSRFRRERPDRDRVHAATLTSAPGTRDTSSFCTEHPRGSFVFIFESSESLNSSYFESPKVHAVEEYNILYFIIICILLTGKKCLNYVSFQISSFLLDNLQRLFLFTGLNFTRFKSMQTLRRIICIIYTHGNLHTDVGRLSSHSSFGKRLF